MNEWRSVFRTLVLKYLTDHSSQLIITLLFGRTWVLNGIFPWAEASLSGEFERTARLKEFLSDARRFIITTTRVTT
ncbi:hypothetical protein LZ554_006224 [Drepanopeziza brunnea f. sp. 'monogermtubi']|nr:hypothetical protein LZ554_006224 [Drepanopeziza brunnea f. sp. 'monogermtubi']